MGDKDPAQFTEGAATKIVEVVRIVKGWVRGHPAPRRRYVPGDDNGEIEYGQPIAAFKTGATITLNPVTDAGVDNGLENVVIWLASDRTVVETPYATGDILSFVRLAAPYDHDDDEDTASIDGILVGHRNGSYGTPYVMLPTAGTRATQLTAQTDTWDRDDQPSGKDGVTDYGPRVAYDSTAHKYYLFDRPKTHDSSGMLAGIGAEAKREIIDLVDCTSV